MVAGSQLELPARRLRGLCVAVGRVVSPVKAAVDVLEPRPVATGSGELRELPTLEPRRPKPRPRSWTRLRRGARLSES